MKRGNRESTSKILDPGFGLWPPEDDNTLRELAQLARALGLGPRGSGFESRVPDHTIFLVKNKVLQSFPEVERPKPLKGQFFVYFLLCCDNSLYCGSTNNLEKRLQLHNSGRGAKYTNSRKPVKLIYFETYDSLPVTLRRESELKSWDRIKKINLIRAGIV